MELITYNKSQLREALLNNTLWKNNDVVPISRNKALLFINNPHAGDNDVLLILAKDHEKTVGYRAMWPDYMISNNLKHKVAWGSCYWVDPSYRGKGIGASLLNKSYELYKQNIGSLAQSDMASRVYEGADKYFKYAETKGYQFIVKSNFAFWVKKKYFKNKILLFPFQCLDGAINLFIKTKQAIWNKQNKLKEINLEYITEIFDNKLIDFINKHNSNDLTPKNHLELNNIIKNPTSLSTPLYDHINSRYFFNTTEDNFYYKYIKISDKNNNILGLLCICIDGNKLYTPFIYCDNKHAKLITNVICRHLSKLNIEMYFTYYPQIINELLNNRFTIVFKRKFMRKSYLSSVFKNIISENRFIHDGDGA